MTAKDLKNALLQEAVQGKLVPQIASEGNARDLLEEIKKEKLSHGFANSYGICDGKNKKSKSSDLRSKSPQRNAPASVVCVTTKELPDITEDEIPFEIPESWCWCRLGELGYTTTGSTPSKSNQNYFGDFIDFLSPGDIQNSIITYGKQGLSRSGYEVSRPTPKGTILQVCIGGSIGKCAITDREVTFNQQINGLTPIFSLSEYLFAVFSSDYFYKKITGNSTGTATPIINKSAWELLPIPLPPLSEQKRIVAAIEKFMPLIEEYGKKESVLKAINEQIGSLTKKAILQEAVQGKLVPQIDAEGNAKDLLEEIRKERLSHGFANSYGICSEKGKKSKSSDLRSKSQIRVTKKELPEITEEEIPFDIPESWCWCRLGEIVYNNGQKAPDKEFSYIDIGSIDNLHQKLNDKENFVSPEQAPSRARKIVKKGDIIYATVRPYLHNICIIDKDFEKEPIASTGFAVLACYPQINNQYLFYYLLSPSFDNYANDIENSKGVAYPAINDDKLYKGVIPLPPLAEQKRIVAAIEKMLPLCEKLGE